MLTADNELTEEELSLLQYKFVAEYENILYAMVKSIKGTNSKVTYRKMMRARKGIAHKLLRHVTKFTMDKE